MVMPIQDALFLLAEAREKPMHVGGLQLFRMPEGADPGTLGQLYRSSLEHGGVHPKLARRPVRNLALAGAWGWENDDQLDLEYHVRHSSLPYPGRIRELLALVSRLHGTLLDRNRPLWEAHLIEGVEDNQFAIYTKIHHALVDGVAATKLLEAALSLDPSRTDMPPPWAAPDGYLEARSQRAAQKAQERDGGGGHSGLIGAVTGAVGAATGAVGATLGGARSVTGASVNGLKSVVKGFQDEAAALPYKAPRSVLNVPITGARRFVAQSYDLGRLAGVRKATGATLNDVVLAMCSGALRGYLLEMDALPTDPLISMVPVSLRQDDDDVESGNQVGVILCNLATHLEDPEERLRLIMRSMTEGKLSLKGLDAAGTMLLSAISFAPLGLGPLFRFEALRKPPFNIVISNVPGPREKLYWRGNELLGTYPLSILTDGQACNITVTTYNGSLEFGILG
ncbi:MAG: diacylglycerol O-acyltransferase, partial [Glaciecola sp.]